MCPQMETASHHREIAFDDVLPDTIPSSDRQTTRISLKLWHSPRASQPSPELPVDEAIEKRMTLRSSQYLLPRCARQSVLLLLEISISGTRSIDFRNMQKNQDLTDPLSPTSRRAACSSGDDVFKPMLMRQMALVLLSLVRKRHEFSYTTFDSTVGM